MRNKQRSPHESALMLRQTHQQNQSTTEVRTTNAAQKECDQNESQVTRALSPLDKQAERRNGKAAHNHKAPRSCQLYIGQWFPIESNRGWGWNIYD